MLACSDNPIMFCDMDKIEYLFGKNTMVQDPVLKAYNESVREGFVFNRESCPLFPEHPFLTSIFLATIFYDYPLPIEVAIST